MPGDLQFKSHVVSHVTMRGNAFGYRAFRSKLISVGKPSLPLHNGLVDYFYVTSTGGIVFLKQRRYMSWVVNSDNNFYDRYYESMCPHGCFRYCNLRRYYWSWSWECYVCKRLCQRVAVFASPFALARLISDPVCDSRFRRRTNILPIHGVFFPMWTNNFVHQHDSSIDIYTLAENNAEIPKLLKTKFPSSTIPSVFRQTFVIRFSKMTHIVDAGSTTTFSVVLGTDYINTYAFLLLDECKKWNLVIPYYTFVYSGYFFPSENWSPPKYFQVPVFFYKDFFDLTIQKAHNFGSSALTKYALGFSLSNNPSNYVNPSIKCYDWLRTNNYTTPVCRTVHRGWGSSWRCYYPQRNARRWCPRSDALISTMGMGFEQVTLPDQPYDVDCYQPMDPPDSIYNFRSVCCYKQRRWRRWTDSKPFYRGNRFLTGPYAGVPMTFVTRENLTTTSGLDKYTEQLKAYRWCCIENRGRLCEDFRWYFPTTWGGLVYRNGGWRGDPHLTTLDGHTYAFNGIGQYLLSRGERSFSDLAIPQSFVLVGQFDTSASVTDATFTTVVAIGAENNGTKSSIFEISLNSDRSDIDLWVDRSRVGSTDAMLSRSGQKFSGGRVKRNNSDFLVTLETGVTLKVHPLKGSLSMDLILDDDYKGNLTGLLGDNNGDPSNDLQNRKGTTVLPLNSTDEEIFPVAKTWAVNCSDPNEALFHGREAGCRALYNDSFVPLFSTGDLFGGNTALRAAALKTCGNNTACVYDVARTKDPDFGKATKDSQESVEKTSAEETNSAPQFANNETEIRVQVGKDGSADVTASDPDKGDSVNVTLETNAPWLTLNGTDLVWSNASDSSTPVNASLDATDSKGLTTSMDVRIQMCDCKANATCIWVEDNKDNFVDVQCNCSRGRSGRYCEIDEDGCVGNPCYAGCTDVPAEDLGDPGKGAGYVCAPCPSGYEGDGENCKDINECSAGTSGCNQTCINTPGRFVCSCSAGFTKANKNCYDINECAQNASRCGDNASCNNTHGGFLCSCNPGYKNESGSCGDVDECSDTPSICSGRANAVCRNTPGSFLCKCRDGFAPNATGACEALDNCLPLNNCSQICTSSGSGFVCSCRSGFSLDGDKISCRATVACSTAQTKNCVGGACARQGDGSSICSCGPGYANRSEGNQTICENINECADLSKKFCQGVASCTDKTPGFSCSCPAGYELLSGLACADIDECALGSHSCNLKISRCVNSAGGYSCSCREGYTRPAGAKNSKTCTDLDECATSSHDCSKDAKCENTEGSFVCACKAGFSGNGRKCEDIDECATLNNCDPEYGVCENSEGSYVCRCRSGFDTAPGSNKCSDIDECKMGKTKTGCFNDTLCTNSPGSYRCACPDGTLLAADGKNCNPTAPCPSGNPCGSAECAEVDGKATCICPAGSRFSDGACKDIDECSENSALCPAKNKVKCVNTHLSYRCDCLDLTTQRKLTKSSCVDINECFNSTLMATTCNRASAVPKCENKDPGFQCYCSDLFFRTVMESGLCKDIDECQLGTHQCEKGSTCQNLVGQGYVCSCPPGYKTVGTKCVDINECESSNGGCEDKCVNSEGSFSCACRPGFQLVGSRCQDIDECARGTAPCDQGCVNTEGSYTCTCQDGFEKVASASGELTKCRARVSCPAGHGCSHLCASIGGTSKCLCPKPSGYSIAGGSCTDVDECKTSPCGKQSVCKNLPGSFRCECTDGYILNANGTGCDDRPGGWAPWAAWSSCSGRCGRTGTRNRTRACSQPEPRGDGLLCLRTDGRRESGPETVAETCGQEPCEMTLEESVLAAYLEFSMSGAINSDIYYNFVEPSLHEFIAKEVTKHCHTNFESCCRGSSSNSWRRLNPNQLLDFVTTSDVFAASDSPRITSDRLVVSLFVKPLGSNALCSDLAAARRRRRAADTRTSLLKDVLTSILKAVNPTEIAAVIAKALSDVHSPLSVQLADIRSAVTLTTTGAPTASTTTGPAAAAKTDAWVIPVAVTLSVLVAVGIVILVVYLIKHQSRVGKLNSHRVDVLENDERSEEELQRAAIIPVALTPVVSPHASNSSFPRQIQGSSSDQFPRNFPKPKTPEPW